MIYTSNNLFIDEADLADMASIFFEKIFCKSKKFFNKLADFDYYFYLTSILQNLPETIIIIFIGFFAVFNLLKYMESGYGNKFYPIITSSMYPNIKPGSLVYSQKVDSYNVGDIVSYTEKTKEGVNTGKVFTHRIISATEDGMFILKGDANINSDPLEINKNQIQGRVAFILPLLGYVEVITKSLPGFLVFILVPCIFLLKRQFYVVRSYFKSN